MSNDNIIVQPELHLARGSVLRILDGSGVQVIVQRGCVWLTQAFDPRDRTICGGLSFGIDRQGHTVVQALSRSVVTLAAPRAEGYARRVDLLPAGTDYALPLYRRESRLSRLVDAWAALLAGARRSPAPTL